MMGPSYQYKAEMLRVIDGDTYVVRVDLGFRIQHTIHVRLRGFNTPELRSSNAAEVEHAKAARDFVMKSIPVGMYVILVTAKAAVFNRWEADVYFNNSNDEQMSLEALLAAHGFARKDNYPV